VRAALRVVGFILLCAIWGSTWLVIKVGYGGLGPFNVAALRFTIAALVLTALVPALGARWPRGRTEWTLVLVVGLLLFGGDYGLIYWAEQYIDSGLTAVLFGTFPLATMFAAHVYVPGEQITPRRLAGGVLALAGVAALFGDRLTVTASAAGPMAAVLGAVACAAVSNVATKRHGGSLHPAALNAATTVVGAVALGTMSVVRGDGLRLPHDGRTWAAIAYLSLVGSVVAFLIYFSLLRMWHATTVSFFAVFTPIIAVVLGAFVLGEHLSVWSAAGSTLVLAGVSLTLKSPAPARAKSRPGSRARSFTRAGLSPFARRSRTPVSPSDLLSFCVGDFITSA
jgi:drug/metabolite transporter (DMT)-like permease